MQKGKNLSHGTYIMSGRGITEFFKIFIVFFDRFSFTQTVNISAAICNRDILHTVHCLISSRFALES